MHNFTHLGLFLSYAVYPAAAVAGENCKMATGSQVLDNMGLPLAKFSDCTSQGSETHVETYAGVETDTAGRTFWRVRISCGLPEECNFAVADAFKSPVGWYGALSEPFAVKLEKLSDGSLKPRLYNLPNAFHGVNTLYQQTAWPYFSLSETWTNASATEQPKLFGETGTVVSAREVAAGGGYRYSMEVKFEPSWKEAKEPVVFIFAGINQHSSEAKTFGLPFEPFQGKPYPLGGGLSLTKKVLLGAAGVVVAGGVIYYFFFHSQAKAKANMKRNTTLYSDKRTKSQQRWL